MSDLSEFLLARIAEDEAADGCHTVDCGVGLGYWATGVCVCGYPARVLADCESKRNVAHLYQRVMADLATETNPVAKVIGSETVDTLRDVLWLLSQPYAHHPDYRSEWAP